MKILTSFVLASTLALPTFAQTPMTKTAPAAPAAPAKEAAAAKEAPAAPVILAATATVSGTLTLKDGILTQTEKSELADGGKAEIKFTVPKDGNYLIHAVVNAVDEDSNSFFLNIDGKPEDPLMIWDMDVTKGFEERIVSWRGNGDASTDEFTPKVFKLTAGAHTLHLVGREPMLLKSVSFQPEPKK